MPDGLIHTLLFADTVAIHLGLALVLGALASQFWLSNSDSAWAQLTLQQSRIVQRGGAVVLLISTTLGLWLQAAVMGDVPLSEAGASVTMMLRDTHFGHAWLFGLGAWGLVTAAVCSPGSSQQSGRRVAICAIGIAAFALSRSVVSHAGSKGDFTVAVGVDWVHLLLVCLWMGIVLMGAGILLPKANASNADRLDLARWVSALSSTATAVLVGVVLTGLFKTWQSTPTVEALVESDYGSVLAAKLALLAVAIALGGANRFLVLPRVFADLRGVEAASPAWQHRLVWILRIEALVLTLVLVAAAVLSGSQPPIDG